MDAPPPVSGATGSAILAEKLASSDFSDPHRSSSQPIKRRRTISVSTNCCLTCRLRKVRCSGNPGHAACSNCARLDLACSFAGAESQKDAASHDKKSLQLSRTTPSHSLTEAGTLRKRAQRACAQCHAHKTKCSGDLPRCKRCEAGGLSCEYTPAKRKFANVLVQNAAVGETADSIYASSSFEGDTASVSTRRTSDTDVSVTSAVGHGNTMDHFRLVIDDSALRADEMLVKRDVLLRHAHAYMENMYWLPCQGFLHPAITFREIEDGTMDPIKAAAICCITAVFVSPGDSGGEFGAKCSAHVEMYLFHNIYRFTEDLLLLFTLSITFNLIRGEYAKVWQSFGVASRLMLGLRVNWDVLPQNQSFAQQESLRRIAWHLFYLDRMLAGGYEEYISCRAENMKIALPCSEHAYRQNEPIDAERLHHKPRGHPSSINMHAYQLRLIDLRHRIQVTTKRLCSVEMAALPQVDASNIMADINRLQNELVGFHMSLPNDIRLSDQSVAKYMASAERSGYVFLHTHLAISHVDLYRFFLPDEIAKSSANVLHRLPSEFVANSQKQAVAHAMSLGRFFDAIQNEVDQMRHTGKLALAGDYSIFQMSTQCVRVLLIALQYGLYRDVNEVATAPLWRVVDVDETHIRSLVDAVQRIIKPWCGVLTAAQQVYDYNATLVAEFNKTREVAESRAGESTFMASPQKPNHIAGPDALLQSMTNGYSEQVQGQQLFTQSLTAWHDQTRTQLSVSGSGILAAPIPSGFSSEVREGHAPGIPVFLEHVNKKAGANNLAPGTMLYDANSPVMTMGDLGSVLPDNHQPAAKSTFASATTRGGGVIPVFQQPIPQPSLGFLMAQQSAFGGVGAHVDHYDVVKRRDGRAGYFTTT